MRTFLATHWKSIVALIILVLLAVFVIPSGSASPALAERLQARASAMARQGCGPAGLHGTTSYIAAALAAQGYQVHVRSDGAGYQASWQVEAWRSGRQAGRHPLRSVILAARYGPGEDELARTAAMLELARLLKTVHPAEGTEIRFVFFIGRSPPAEAPFGSFVAYTGPRAALGRASQALAYFRDTPDGAAGALAAPAWVQGLTLGHLDGRSGAPDSAMLVADIGSLHSPLLPASHSANQPDYKSLARVLLQLAQSVGTLAGTTNS